MRNPLELDINLAARDFCVRFLEPSRWITGLRGYKGTGCYTQGIVVCFNSSETRRIEMACSVGGCGKEIRSLGFCYAHYMRFYRNGSTDSKRIPKKFAHSRGYILTPAEGHFLARGSSHAYEHRINFHAENGDGPFKCHWCSKTVSWDDMHVDHLDETRTNNDASNLVASCPTCNQARGRERQRASIIAAIGRMITAHGETLTISEWSRRSGVSRSSIATRLKNGWSPDIAVSEPRGNRGPLSKAKATEK